MSRLIWDNIGARFYETGVEKGVLYPMATSGDDKYPAGVAWSGLTKISESPSGAEPTKLYANNTKYGELISNEEFAGTIEAYTYPDEFAACDGSETVADGVTITQQARKAFGLAYRTEIGNDTEGTDYGYKIHLVYNAKAKPSSKERNTINENPEASTMSWEFSTTPVSVSGKKPTSHLIVDSKKAGAAKIAQLEAILYGVDATAFSSTGTYAVGDYVTNESKTYICKTAVTSGGAFAESNWTEITNVGPRLPLPDEVITLIGLTAQG